MDWRAGITRNDCVFATSWPVVADRRESGRGKEGSEDCTISISLCDPPRGAVRLVRWGRSRSRPGMGQTDGKRGLKREMWSALTCRRGSGIRNSERVTIEREAGRGQGTVDGRKHAIKLDSRQPASERGKGGKRDVQMDQSREKNKLSRGNVHALSLEGGQAGSPSRRFHATQRSVRSGCRCPFSSACLAPAERFRPTDAQQRVSAPRSLLARVAAG